MDTSGYQGRIDYGQTKDVRFAAIKAEQERREWETSITGRTIMFFAKLLTNFAGWCFARLGIVALVHKNDAAIVFRDKQPSGPDEYFPWHLRPEVPPGEDREEMPTHLSAATHLMFAIRKGWLMRFIGDYLNNPEQMEAEMAAFGLAHELREHMHMHTGEGIDDLPDLEEDGDSKEYLH